MQNFVIWLILGALYVLIHLRNTSIKRLSEEAGIAQYPVKLQKLIWRITIVVLVFIWPAGLTFDILSTVAAKRKEGKN